jgi:multidrug efflux pump subunit AcrA (membrane-fusion protein)
MRASVASLHVVAPFAAQVRTVFKQPGEVVQQGEVVAEVINTDKVRVEGDLKLSDLPFVAPAAQVRVRLEGTAAAPDLAQHVFAGTLTFVDVKVEPVSQTVRIAAEVNNATGQLREGLKATLFIPKSTAEPRQP